MHRKTNIVLITISVFLVKFKVEIHSSDNEFCYKIHCTLA